MEIASERVREGEVETSPGEVTVLLAELKRGNKDALGKLVPLVYAELRRLAAHYMRDERVGHTLQPTAVVHEAYLRLAGQDWAEWQNRAQFMGVAARQMRRILVDYARQRAAAKRGGAPVKVDLDVKRDWAVALAWLRAELSGKRPA